MFIAFMLVYGVRQFGIVGESRHIPFYNSKNPFKQIEHSKVAVFAISQPSGTGEHRDNLLRKYPVEHLRHF